MKTNTVKSLLTPFVLFAALFISSCQDDAEKPSTIDDTKKKENVENVLALREELNFVNRFVDEMVIDISSEGGRASFTKTTISRLKAAAPCAEATEEELPDGSVKVIMNFGDGCQMEDGIEVAGKVVMVVAFSETTFEYFLEFTDYSEIREGNQGEVINGTVDGRFVLDLSTSDFLQEIEQDLTITYTDNTKIKYKAAQSAVMTETGLRVTALTTSGNFADGGEFTMTLNKTLVYDFSCKDSFPVEGEETLTFQGNRILVNYGDGTCDDMYVVK